MRRGDGECNVAFRIRSNVLNVIRDIRTIQTDILFQRQISKSVKLLIIHSAETLRRKEI